MSQRTGAFGMLQPMIGLRWVSRAWAATKPSWGIWSVPETELELLPEDMTGMDVIELGCGTAYVSSWIARRGASVTCLDTSAAQLATARRLASEHGISLSFIHGSAETVPVPDCSFDLAVNEYGAATWCDPEAWLHEAHRLLRPGGRLVFLTNHPLAMTCAPTNGAIVADRLARPYFGMHTLDWREVEIDPGGVSFCLPISDWMALFRRVGFVVDDLREPRAPESAEGAEFFADAEWSKHWPSELVWNVRRT